MSDGRRRYLCVTDGCRRVCESHHTTLVREKTVIDRRGQERKVTIKGSGLGTWHCPIHGATKVRVARGGNDE